MANRKKKVYKPKPMTLSKRNIIQGLLQEYDIETAEDIQEALGYTGALKAPVRCFGNHLSEKRESLFQTR